MGLRPGQILLENVKLVYRNFAGAEKTFNKSGDRNFAVVLDDANAVQLSRDGWRVKTRPDRDGEGMFYTLPVAIASKRLPAVTLIGSRSRNVLTEETFGLADLVDLQYADVIIRPYDWTINGESGRKAYLASAFLVLDEDPLQLKYADVPYQNQPPRNPDEDYYVR